MIGFLRAFIPAWLQVAVEAVREHYDPRRNSALIKEYPERTMMAVELMEPLRVDLDERWVFQIDTLTVADCEKLTRFQAQIEAHYKALQSVPHTSRTELALNKLHIQGYTKIVRFLYALSKWHYKSHWERRAYWRALSYKCLKDPRLGTRLLRETNKFHSNIESFFFHSNPKSDSGDVQRKTVDSWRTIRCNYWRGEWGDFLQAPVLKIFMIIADEWEKSAQLKAQRQAVDGGN